MFTKLLLLNILPLSPFFLSLSFSSIYTRCLPTHHKNTRRCVLRVRDRENENESETQSGDLESLRRASKRERERDQFESLYTLLIHRRRAIIIRIIIIIFRLLQLFPIPAARIHPKHARVPRHIRSFYSLLLRELCFRFLLSSEAKESHFVVVKSLLFFLVIGVPSFSEEKKSAFNFFFLAQAEKAEKTEEKFQCKNSFFRRRERHKKQKEEKKRDKTRLSFLFSFFISLLGKKEYTHTQQQHKHALAREVKRER